VVDYDVSQGVCVLRLNSPPVNALTFALVEELRAAVRRAGSDPAVRGIVLTGTPTHFSAGADVNLFRELASAAAPAAGAERMARVFQEAFQEVEDSPRPVVAAVAGRMMGAALELAMACHFRICARGATFGMPEVHLGILPGAGGTGRLPRLVGPAAALKMLLTGEAIDADEALRLGLVDEVCDGAALLERAGEMARTACTPRRTSRLTAKLADAAALAEADKLLSKGRPEVIAPRKIAEAVRAGIAECFEAALQREQSGFAECMATAATRSKIHVFFATRETGKVPELAGAEAAEVSRAAVIGMGTMGTGIAQALIAAGIPVVVRDEDEAALGRGMERVRRSVERRVEEGKLSPDGAGRMLGLLSVTTRWGAVADADLVIEAVYENVATKRSVIAAIEAACRPSAIVASNTSTLSLDVLAAGMRRPERLVGMHFFNPAHRMPLVEIVRRDGAARAAVATALKLAKSLRKTPVLVRNREGFLVNRIFIPYLKEAFWLLEEGAAPEAIDAAMTEFGFPMGPLALSDMAGLDILLATDRVLSGAFPRHGALSAIVARLVEQGCLGQKTAAGVYSYAPGDHTPRPRRETAELVRQVQAGRRVRPRAFTPDEITRRLVLRMACEAFYVLEEGIALRPSDIDAATVLGTGFPDFRGGVLRYANDLGLGRVRAELETLARDVGERYAPPESLAKGR